MSEIRTENWMGYDIRFIEQDGEWWAILKDICDALHLRTSAVAQRLESRMLCRVKIETSNDSSNDLRSRGENKSRWMLAVNENGVYEALFASRRLEARQFRAWTSDILKKLRRHIGLEGYEVMRMADQDVQDDIDHFLDDLFYDEDTGQLMQSVTVAGGDVIQEPFEF